jgi:glycosyltransferase involved in cell wall biosynthesis
VNPRTHLGRAAQRWLGPRIGTLRQHPPRPLLVPASYFRSPPPQPAPTIAIVTPSFEQGQYLERTIRSVLQQGYPALEYVVQDGGSSDESVAVIRRHEDRLLAWRSDPDRGQADAINRGFAQTRGEIMGWLNSDDVLLPGALAYVARFFSQHPDADVVYGDRLMIDEQDREIGAWLLPAHDDGVLRVTDFVPQETLFWRRSAWESAGGALDLEFEYALDWDLLLRLQQTGARMVHVPRFLGAFRVHERQKSLELEEVGLREIAELRRRTHGREAMVEEFPGLLRPYLAKHRAIDARHRVLRRMPLPRRQVTFEFDAPPG